MSEWTFSTATLEDLESILKLEKLSFRNPWSRRAIEEELRREDAYCYVLNRISDLGGTAALGYAIFRVILNEIHVMRICIDPAWRRRGAASCLLDSSIRRLNRLRADRMLLEVRAGNEAAIRLYEKSGFRPIGKRTRYYLDNGEDALVMQRDSKEEP
ncbi:MAG: ribosomal protein S18-alanine N-acetyltransferase [Desulfobacterales bacterium]